VYTSTHLLGHTGHVARLLYLYLFMRSLMTADYSMMMMMMMVIIIIIIKKKVEQSRYRPGVTQRVPGS
jgi:hypothetical protein